MNSPLDTVRDFYSALTVGDTDRVRAIAEVAFAEDMAVELPASLPYGGRIVGASRLSRMFVAMAGGPGDIGPRDLTVEDVVGAGDVVIARVSFGYRLPSGEIVASGALEEWTFEAGRVVSLRAYYADTAPLVAAS